MMHFITGKPGNCKTLYALFTIAQIAERDNRQVYYHGITLLPAFPHTWILIERPNEWPLLPPGAIIVFDEAQKIFPRRPNGSHVPPHVSAFETHRHNGFDIYLLTQDPSFVDNHVVKLSEKHFHCIRQFGMQKSVIYEAQQAMSTINAAALKNCIPHKFPFPRHVFTWYKSAELHTHKRSLPLRYLMLPVLLFVFIGLVWWTIVFVRSLGKPKEGSQTSAGVIGTASTQLAPLQSSSPVLSRSDYLNSYIPRVNGTNLSAKNRKKRGFPYSPPHPENR